MRSRWPLRSRARSRTPGLHYDAGFLSKAARAEVLSWLSTVYPLWENRFSEHRPLPPGETQRQLLRPVYWLGNWQFACLDYYRPPHGVLDRCVEAEPFPKALAVLVTEMEARARGMFRGDDMPPAWHLNTCLVNLYGSRLEAGRWVDTARVGEHKDFEPGPVASLSLGERALFQFVTSSRPGERDDVVEQQWLDDGSLQLFGGERWKSRTFHRVQRVDTKGGHRFEVNVSDFETRRINFTFRYVPDRHVVPFKALSPDAQRDVEASVRRLAQHSRFFAAALAAAGR
ncbi:MAG: alpha-ketoglutarate-dependent dioxygenase AlkB [Myxococcaceae bacterium]|jgi:alkylated DNA repair protein (DNA oxidative demethylase)|nr:alpha-ketoglutarate-dependent dioxygenase AlkB [Myxococcaceae bacterium]MCA3015963.1 alpha-ketoglutarate-dependent dioxygenase AlkB [Myxococcaceae bacterium]